MESSMWPETMEELPRLLNREAKAMKGSHTRYFLTEIN